MGRTTMRRGQVRWVAAVLAALVALVLAPPRARADEPTVALLMDEANRADIGRELLVALAERHARVVAGDAPAGETPLVRAAVAQKRARRLGAQLAVWVESGTRGSDLHAVRVEGAEPHRAPLPGLVEELEPRVVATVAASLIDELWAGAPGADAPADDEAPPATLTVELRALPEPEVAPGPLPLGPLPPLEEERPVWSLALGGSFLTDAIGAELRFVRRTPAARSYIGGWMTMGSLFSHDERESWGTGLELGLASDPTSGFTASLFGGAGLTQPEARPVSLPPPGAIPDGADYRPLGRGFLTGGARVGLAIALTHHLGFRVDVSGAIEASQAYGTGFVSWLSFLAEVRQ